jgi:hypothetical protein
VIVRTPLRFRSVVQLAGLLLGLLLQLGLSQPAAAAKRPKTDIVTFDGGNTLVCEIKQLERGKLRVSSSNAGTIDIEWEHVETIQSVFTWELELSDGDRYYGFLSVGEEDRTVVLTDLADILEFSLADVVRLTPIYKTFLGRVDGSLSLGLTYAQANNAATFNFGFDASLRSKKYLRKVSVTSSITDQDEVDRIERNVASFEFSRYLAPPWSVVTSIQGESNNELSLDLRTSLSIGARRQGIQTNSMLLNTLTGLAVNEEKYSTEESSSSSVEVVLQVAFEKFSFDTPEIDVRTSLTLLPNLTDWGRVRLEFDLRLRRELVKDFFLDLTAYESYDSNPGGAAGESSNDWGFTTSLGWSF